MGSHMLIMYSTLAISWYVFLSMFLMSQLLLPGPFLLHHICSWWLNCLPWWPQPVQAYPRQQAWPFFSSTCWKQGPIPCETQHPHRYSTSHPNHFYFYQFKQDLEERKGRLEPRKSVECQLRCPTWALWEKMILLSWAAHDCLKTRAVNYAERMRQ